jgi:hypothetical protein
MPSVSKAQAQFMRAAANSPKFAKKVGIPSKVAKEYMAEDKKSGKSSYKKQLKKEETGMY